MNKKLFQKHQLQQLQNTKDKFKVATLTGAITFLIAQSTLSYASDIEIYIKPSSDTSSATVILMLDTSGSMDIKQSTGACDLDSYTYSATDIDDPRGFKVNKCLSDIKYYYKKERWQGGKLYKCHNNAATGSNNYNDCNKSNAGSPDLSAYYVVSDQWHNYYFRAGTEKLDRISRLKEALYILATTPTYDPELAPDGIKENVNIGIGTYPYYKEEGTDRWGDPVVKENNKRGYIRLPAAKWDSSQKQKVLDMIARDDFR